MHVTTKGQVTIPKAIRNKLGIVPHSEVDFVEERGRIYLVKSKKTDKIDRQVHNLRGSASVAMTTDEILKLTRTAKK